MMTSGSASVGPSPRGDGNALDPCAPSQRSAQLQWGRLRGETETCVLPFSDTRICLLQWGRLRGETETDLSSQGATTWTSFNGAVSAGRRKRLWRLRYPNPGAVSFNGAVSAGRRKPDPRVREEPQHDVLQWG